MAPTSARCTAWALFGSLDWDSLVVRVRRRTTRRDSFDLRAPPPRPTALVRLHRQLAAGERPRIPLASCPSGGGAGRLSSAGVRGRSPMPADAAPILIVGARGTLGSAFQRMCAARGLPVALVARHDWTYRSGARRRRAATCPAVGSGQRRRLCAGGRRGRGGVGWLRLNSDGPVSAGGRLSATSRVPLVTFSSDLVFDGAASRPYVEADSGRAAQRVRSRERPRRNGACLTASRGLDVRTSAFFGPWTTTISLLARARDRPQEPFQAADDCVVSPTYIPDLVDAVLDLLIDSERGIWHLANKGAVTWLEFARSIAAGMASGTQLITPCRWRDVSLAARRPAYSVLSSERGMLLQPLGGAIEAYCTMMTVRLADEATECASS